MLQLTTTVNFEQLKLELQVFQDETDVIWFHGASVCDCMNLVNPSLAILRKVDEIWRKRFPYGRGESHWFVQEPGFYQLAFVAKTKSAKEFQQWVFSEVLPSIRQKGGYISNTATSEQLEALNAQIFAMAQKIDEIQAQKRVLEIEKQQITDRKQHEWEIELDGKSGHPVSHERYLLEEKQAFEAAFKALKRDIETQVTYSRKCQLKTDLIEVLEKHKTPKQLTGK